MTRAHLKWLKFIFSIEITQWLKNDSWLESLEMQRVDDLIWVTKSVTRLQLGWLVLGCVFGLKPRLLWYRAKSHCLACTFTLSKFWIGSITEWCKRCFFLQKHTPIIWVIVSWPKQSQNHAHIFSRVYLRDSNALHTMLQIRTGHRHTRRAS